MLVHRHSPAECRVAHAAWRTFDSPLRGQMAQTTCGRHRPTQPAPGSGASDVHELWCVARADDDAAALAQLPPYVAERAEAREVTEVIVG
jgi:hypothetical protein